MSVSPVGVKVGVVVCVVVYVCILMSGRVHSRIEAQSLETAFFG